MKPQWDRGSLTTKCEWSVSLAVQLQHFCLCVAGGGAKAPYLFNLFVGKMCKGKLQKGKKKLKSERWHACKSVQLSFKDQDKETTLMKCNFYFFLPDILTFVKIQVSPKTLINKHKKAENWSIHKRSIQTVRNATFFSLPDILTLGKRKISAFNNIADGSIQVMTSEPTHTMPEPWNSWTELHSHLCFLLTGWMLWQVCCS